MVAKARSDVSEHAESPTPMPVMSRSTGFLPGRRAFFAGSITSVGNHVITDQTSRIVGTSNQAPQTVSLAEYVRKAMRHATYEVLSDGTFYAEIPGFQGVWANTSTLEACVEELRSALEDWVLLCVSDGLNVPEVDGVRFMGKE